MQNVANSNEERDDEQIGIDELRRGHDAVRAADVRDAGAGRVNRVPVSASEQALSDSGHGACGAAARKPLARDGVLA
jgi:hypothetical protein